PRESAIEPREHAPVRPNPHSGTRPPCTSPDYPRSDRPLAHRSEVVLEADRPDRCGAQPIGSDGYVHRAAEHGVLCDLDLEAEQEVDVVRTEPGIAERGQLRIRGSAR